MLIEGSNTEPLGNNRGGSNESATSPEMNG
jgi:hypothetical protein